MTYTEWVVQRAAELGADGCTGVTNLYGWCCLEHDVLYRTGMYRDGRPCTKSEADDRFRSCIRRSSTLGWWNPIAWWRWYAVHRWATFPSGRRASLLSVSLDEKAADAVRRRNVMQRELEAGK